MQRRKENAFTLVELLLVVTIIGILAGAVMLNFSGKTEEAKITRARSDIAALGTALGIFEITLGQYPTSDQGLHALIEDPGIEGWKKRFVQKNSIKDPWGNDYSYAYPGSHDNDYDLFSVGPDQQEGTEDDIGNWSEEE